MPRFCARTRSAKFGKPVGKDLKEGKITLPLIYTLSNFENAEIQRLEEQFKNQKATEEDYKKMITLVRNDGVLERIRSEAEEYMDKASRLISAYPDSSAKAQMLSLNAYLIRRHF